MVVAPHPRHVLDVSRTSDRGDSRNIIFCGSTDHAADAPLANMMKSRQLGSVNCIEAASRNAMTGYRIGRDQLAGGPAIRKDCQSARHRGSADAARPRLRDHRIERLLCCGRSQPLLALVRHRRSADRLPLSGGDLNRSTQHLLILLDKEVADGDVTDIVHGEAEG